jgi:4-hydroxybenzoate polyprenyltransferase
MPYSKTLRALRNFGDSWTMLITSVVHVALAAILIVAAFLFPAGRGLIPVVLVLPVSAAINIHHWISSATRKQKEQDI